LLPSTSSLVTEFVIDTQQGDQDEDKYDSHTTNIQLFPQ
jgi:hypothetical protein